MVLQNDLWSDPHKVIQSCMHIWTSPRMELSVKGEWTNGRLARGAADASTGQQGPPICFALERGGRAS